jgi:hypothetical protein
LRWWGSSFWPSGIALSGLRGSGANPAKPLDVLACWKQVFRGAPPKAVSCPLRSIPLSRGD